jgi:hypothetical protein
MSGVGADSAPLGLGGIWTSYSQVVALGFNICAPLVLNISERDLLPETASTPGMAFLVD